MATALTLEAPRPSAEPSLIPRRACRLVAPCQFQEVADDEPDLRPFRMLARTADAIEHPYWGRIVHDLSGMQLRKPTLPVDVAHEPGSEIGFADKFSATAEGLIVEGALVVLESGDIADRIFRRSKAGIPYEASIDWIGAGAEIEFVPEGASDEVNGREFEGPLYVVRSWPLRAVSIVPHGSDPDTSTQFGGTDEVSAKVFAMAKATPEPEAQATADTKTESANGDAINRDTLKQFSEAFGDQALGYLGEGLTFEAAQLRFSEHKLAESEVERKKLFARIGELEAERDAIAKQLKQISDSNGQATAVATETDGDGSDEPARVFSGLRAVRAQA